MSKMKQSILVVAASFFGALVALCLAAAVPSVRQMVLFDASQFGFTASNSVVTLNGLIPMTNGAAATNVWVWTNQFVLTNSQSTNGFLIGGTTNTNTTLGFFASGDPAGQRAWQVNAGASNFNVGAFDDLYTNGLYFLQATRGPGTNITRVYVTANSNGNTCFTFWTPTGFQIGAGGTPIAQLSTYDSGTNNAWPSAGATKPFAHGFPGVPMSYRVVMVNVTGELGWSAGDEVDALAGLDNSGTGALPPFFQVWCDGTNVNVIRANIAAGNNLPVILRKDTGVPTAIASAGNWKLRVYASYLR